jgi:hypothetical protein
MLGFSGADFYVRSPAKTQAEAAMTSFVRRNWWPIASSPKPKRYSLPLLWGRKKLPCQVRAPGKSSILSHC